MNREPSVFPVAPATVFPAESKPGVPDGLCDQIGAPMSTPDHDSIARESLQAENESLLARATQAEQERDALAGQLAEARSEYAEMDDRIDVQDLHLAEIEAERDRWEARFDITNRDRQDAEAERDAAQVDLECAQKWFRAERDRLRTALERYGNHLLSCAFKPPKYEDDCSCGFAEDYVDLGSTTEPEEQDIEAPPGITSWWPATKLGVSIEFVAGVLSTFPPYDQKHPEECVPMAKAVMRAIAEETFQDDLRAAGSTTEPEETPEPRWEGHPDSVHSPEREAQ